MAYLSCVHTFVSGVRHLAAGPRLNLPTGAAACGLLLSNFKGLIEGGLMILSCTGPGPTRNASDYYNYATRMPEAARQRHGGLTGLPAGPRTYQWTVTVPRLLLVPIGMGSRLNFQLRAYACWHGFWLALASAFWHGLGHYDAICNVARLCNVVTRFESVHGRTSGHRGSSGIIHRLLLSVQDGGLRAAARTQEGWELALRRAGSIRVRRAVALPDTI